MLETFYIEEIASNLMLYRFTETKTEFRSEYLAGNKWIQDNSLIDVLRDSRSEIYKEISKEEAVKIVKQLGGSIHD